MTQESSAGPVIWFDAFEADLRSGELRKHGLKLRIGDQPFSVLALLLAQPGEVVTRDDLQKRLWPADTFVDFERGLNKAINRLREALGDSADRPSFIETLPKRGYRFIAVAEIGAAPEALSVSAPIQQPSIAVLPFANMSSSKDDEYFSDGLSEEIINALTHVPGLKVTARTSAFAFKTKNQDIRKIARALGVTNVLEGSVRRAGNRLRVTAELIHAADGTHLWSQRYDRELTDVFAVQDEISAAIVGTLRVKMPLSGATARPHEPSLRAYEAFLKGKQYQHHRVLKTAKQQIARIEGYFNEAIVLDPQWADPHSGLGSQRFFLAALGWRPPSETIPLARAEAWKALELFPSEPVAHGVLGAIAAVHDFDWEEAEKHFNLARAPESVSPSVHHMY